MSVTQHVPVMVKEVLRGLHAEAGGDFLDCTLGGGGHTRALLDANARTTVVGADRDPCALERATEHLRSCGARLSLLHARFSELATLLPDRKFDGMLADLGLSSDQLAEGRGFSFSDEGALDMRMDFRQAKTARDVVNDTGERELYALLRRGGVGQEARTLARAIVRARPIETTAQLADTVRSAYPPHRAKHTDPATVAFQAIRIEVNDELQEIESLLEFAPHALRRPGRLAIISFHSLEDKHVARRMREWSGSHESPALWPGGQAPQRLGSLLTKKALQPDETEVRENPRSRSARLRIFEFA